MARDCDLSYDEAIREGRYTNSWGPDNCMRAWVDQSGCVRMQYSAERDPENYSAPDIEYNDDGDPLSEESWYPTYGAQACLEGTALAFVGSEDGKRALEVYAKRAGWATPEDVANFREENRLLRRDLARYDGTPNGLTLMQATAIAGYLSAFPEWELHSMSNAFMPVGRYTITAYHRTSGRNFQIGTPMTFDDVRALIERTGA